MKGVSRIAGAMLAAAACTSAQAIDCAKATSNIERRLCADPALAHLDEAVSTSYRKVRAATAATARAALLQQQRAWLAKRDRTCATADSGCLSRLYTERLDQLAALNASATTNGGELRRVAPVMLRGRWRVAAPSVPGGALPAAGAELARQLDFAGLPRVGETVSAAPGKLCVADQPCDTFRWSATTVGKLEGGARIASDLGLAPDRAAYTGSNGSPRSSLTLIAGKGGELFAIFGLCGPAATQCRNAIQPWHPTMPAAGFAIGDR